MDDKEEVVGRLTGKELKSFRISAKNAVSVLVEAYDEEGAKKEFDERVDKNYDWPWENAEDYDGWEIEEVEDEG